MFPLLFCFGKTRTNALSPEQSDKNQPKSASVYKAPWKREKKVHHFFNEINARSFCVYEEKDDKRLSSNHIANSFDYLVANGRVHYLLDKISFNS